MHEYAVDVETSTMMHLASALDLAHIKYWPVVRRAIRERMQMFESGRMQAPKWFRKRLWEIDPLLDLRWDYLKASWLIERYSRVDRAFVNIMYIERLDSSVFLALHEADTWRFPSPEAYIRHKHDQAARRRAQVEKEGDEKVAAAIDALSTKQADEFVAVEQAMATGETVVLHGKSEKIMDNMIAGSKRAQAKGIPPINPGLPLYRRHKKPKIEGE